MDAAGDRSQCSLGFRTSGQHRWGLRASLRVATCAVQLRTDPIQESELSRGFWPLSSCKPSAGRLTGTWSPRHACALLCSAQTSGLAELEIQVLGRLVKRASALSLVFEHQADSSTDVLACYLPTRLSQNDHPDCCPETEESGNKWRPIWERQGMLRHGN